MTQKQPTLPRNTANLSPAKLSDAIRKLNRRLTEIEDIAPRCEDDITPRAQTIVEKVNATYCAIFGQDTVEYEEAKEDTSGFYVMAFQWHFQPHSIENSGSF